MKEVNFDKSKYGGRQCTVREYESMSEFTDHINHDKLHSYFDKNKPQSETLPFNFTQTNSFNEAVTLFSNGWTEKATELQKKLEASKIKNLSAGSTVKNFYSVSGFQASVPRYLQGIPENMINSKKVVNKQKVITFNKAISYSAGVSANQILEESVKALTIIAKIESQGVRCNLNVVQASHEGDHTEIIKVRIKSANERLNISKVAFPMVHPSMLRRLMFRAIEISNTVQSDFFYGYGHPLSSDILKKILNDQKEQFIPPFINVDINEIHSLDDLTSGKVNL